MTILIEKKLTFFLLAISFTTPFVCGLKFNGIIGLSQQSYHYPTATNLLQSTGSCFCANRCNFRRYRHLSASTNPPQSSSYGDDTAGGGGKSIGTESQLKEYANNLGIIVSLTTLGPGYRSVARAAHDEEQILGYCEGFIRPGGKILHVDKLEVWKKAIDRAKMENPNGFKNGAPAFGISLLLGYICLLNGRKQGCSTAEFLAIDDEEFQHKRLVKFFNLAGFKTIRYVGDDLQNIPDRLVWGGCGTLMNEKIDNLLARWNKILSR